MSYNSDATVTFQCALTSYSYPDELHDEVELVRRLVVLDELHDVGVFDAAQDVQLALNHVLFTFALQLIDDLQGIVLSFRPEMIFFLVICEYL